MLLALARRSLWIGLTALLGLLAWTTWIVGQAISDKPAVSVRPTHPVELWRGKAVVRQILLPSRHAGANAPDIRLGPRDLELGLNYLLNRTRLGQARLNVADDGIRVDASLLLPKGLPGRFLNAGMVLQPQGQGLGLAHLVLGRTQLPTPVSRLLVRLLLRAAPGRLELSQVDQLLLGMSLSGNASNAHLVWRGTQIQSVMNDMRMQVLGLDEALMRPYRQALAEAAGRRPRPSFAAILGDLFKEAQQRSQRNDPVRENRALLLALAEAVNDFNLGAGRPAAGARLHGLRLAGRGDFVEHLSLSAALAVVAGSQVADAAGLLKEVGDSELGGSGFSFTDLAVDRAGARLGHLAVESADSARRLQALLADTDKESLFLPRVRDLPEFISASEFQRRFGGVNGSGYLALVEEIEHRLDALPLYRDGRP